MRTRAQKIRAGIVLGLLLIQPSSAQAADAESQVMHMAPLEFSGDGAKVKIRVSSVPNGCAWGDMDAIDSELRVSKKPSLILSLEPLLASDSVIKPIVHDISKIDLTKGYAATVNLPKSSKPVHLALYVCRDAEGSGRCGNKPLVPVQTVLNQYTVPVDPKTKTATFDNKKPPEPKDKAYYFGYVLLTKNGVGVTRSKLQEADYAKLETLLVGMGSQAGVAKAIKAKSDPLDSVQPMLTEKGVISLFLPKLDKSSCPTK